MMHTVCVVHKTCWSTQYVITVGVTKWNKLCNYSTLVKHKMPFCFLVIVQWACNNCMLPILYLFYIFHVVQPEFCLPQSYSLTNADWLQRRKPEMCLCVCTCCAHIWLNVLNGDTGKSFSLFTAERSGDKHFIMPKMVWVNSRSRCRSFIRCLNCRRGKKG